MQTQRASDMANAMAHMSAEGCTFWCTLMADTSTAKPESDFDEFRELLDNAEAGFQIRKCDIKLAAEMAFHGNYEHEQVKTRESFMQYAHSHLCAFSVRAFVALHLQDARQQPRGV
jgi:hypothetical protein